MPILPIRPSRLMAALALLLVSVCSGGPVAAPLKQTPSRTRRGSLEGALAGRRAAIAGDVNGGALVYDTLRSTGADTFVGAATGLESDDGVDRAAMASESPAASSPTGTTSSGVPHQGRFCP